MFKHVFMLALIAVFIFSCKKKDTNSQPASNASSATTTGGSFLSPSTGGDYCELQTTYMYTNYNGTVTKDSSIFATFYATPPTTVAPAGIYAGTVTLNGTALPYISSNNYYYPSAGNGINIAGPLAWSVSGSGTVTAFSQSFTPSYPKYTGGNLLPDTCIKANGITINISGVTNNQNSVTVYLFAGSASAFKYIFGSGGSVTFTTADLANFGTQQSMTIMVDFTNAYSATHNGIKHGFVNSLSYQKLCYLK